MPMQPSPMRETIAPCEPSFTFFMLILDRWLKHPSGYTFFMERLTLNGIPVNRANQDASTWSYPRSNTRAQDCSQRSAAYGPRTLVDHARSADAKIQSTCFGGLPPSNPGRSLAARL